MVSGGTFSVLRQPARQAAMKSSSNALIHCLSKVFTFRGVSFVKKESLQRHSVIEQDPLFRNSGFDLTEQFQIPGDPAKVMQQILIRRDAVTVFGGHGYGICGRNLPKIHFYGIAEYPWLQKQLQWDSQ